MGIKRTAAGRIYYDADDDRQSQVLGLLGQIGDRLQRSDSEREELSRELQEYRRLVADLEDKAAKAEKVVAAVSGKLGRVDHIEAEFAKRQEALDRAAQEQAQKIARVVQVHSDVERRLIAAENAAASFESRIAETVDQQSRLNRKLEKIAQDKIRLLRKLERMEEAVVQTQEALQAKAMVLLTDRALLPDRTAPSLEDAPAFISKSSPSFDFEPESAPLWKRPVRVQLPLMAGLVALALGAGWLVASMLSSGRTADVSAVLAVSEQAATPSPPEALTPPASPVSAPAQGALPVPQDISMSAAVPDPLTADDRQVAAAFDRAPEALAARLNAIEPSAAASAVDWVREPVAPSVDVKPMSFPPQETASQAAPKKGGGRQSNSPPSSAKVSPPSAPAPEEPLVAPANMSKVDAAPRSEGRPLTRVVDAAPDPSLPTSLKSIEEKALAGVAEAQHDLAAVYTAGHGGAPQNYEKAAFWFGKAAGQGIANARYNLGVLYQQGLGVPKNMREAIKWYRAAADLGHPEARYNLGIACIEGVGVPYDPRKAAEYFESAAAGGVTEAAYNLGLIYENGLLGKPAPEEALLWYKKAADKGSADAKAALAQLSKSLHIVPEDLDRVVNRAQTEALLNAAETGVEPPVSTPRPAAGIKAKGAARAMDPPVPPPPVDSALDGQAVGTGQTAVLGGSLDRVIISQIQDQLKDMGMYNGPSDGALGPMTADAIRSYQVRNDLPADGQPNESLLIHMLAREIRD